MPSVGDREGWKSRQKKKRTIEYEAIGMHKRVGNPEARRGQDDAKSLLYPAETIRFCMRVEHAKSGAVERRNTDVQYRQNRGSRLEDRRCGRMQVEKGGKGVCGRPGVPKRREPMQAWAWRPGKWRKKKTSEAVKYKGCYYSVQALAAYYVA